MRLSRKNKKLKPVLIDIEKLAKKDDIDAIINKIESLRLTETERTELKILSDWNKLEKAQKKEKYNLLSQKNKHRLLYIINKWEGGQDEKRK